MAAENFNTTSDNHNHDSKNLFFCYYLTKLKKINRPITNRIRYPSFFEWNIKIMGDIKMCKCRNSSHILSVYTILCPQIYKVVQQASEK